MEEKKNGLQPLVGNALYGLREISNPFLRKKKKNGVVEYGSYSDAFKLSNVSVY